MNDWKNFLENKDNAAGDHDKPGKILICFVNRFLEGLDGIKYKIIVDGNKEVAGETSENNYCIELTPLKFTPIETYVWSRIRRKFKKLDDTLPRKVKKILIRKRLNTFKVLGVYQEHPRNIAQAMTPKQPTSTPTPGTSPVGNQGVESKTTKDENDAPLRQSERPVPNQITKEQLKKIFPLASLSYLQRIAEVCNKDLSRYKLDTPYRKAHFFGQVKQEAGPRCGENSLEENFNYSKAGLIGTFGYYQRRKSEVGEDGRRRKAPLSIDQQKIIANKIYGDYEKGDDLGNYESGDGWRFRGRGIKQITGRHHYQQFSKSYGVNFGEDTNFEQQPELVATFPHSVHSAIYFWLRSKNYIDADKGITDDAIDSVTKKINSGEIAQHKKKKYKGKNNPVLKRRENVKGAYKELSNKDAIPPIKINTHLAYNAFV